LNFILPFEVFPMKRYVQNAGSSGLGVPGAVLAVLLLALLAIPAGAVAAKE
jgi:hypothetical protein